MGAASSTDAADTARMDAYLQSQRATPPESTTLPIQLEDGTVITYTTVPSSLNAS